MKMAPKKQKCSPSESESLSLSKRSCNKGDIEFTVPRKKHRAFLHGTWSGPDWRVNSQASQGRGALEDTNIKTRSRFKPKQQGSCTTISENFDSIPDDISVEAREGSRILSGESQMLERMTGSKSVSSSQLSTNTLNRGEKHSVGIQKHQGLEEFKCGTSKQRSYVSFLSDLSESEDELNANMPTVDSVHNYGADNPLSVRNASSPFQYFTSLPDEDDKGYPSRPSPSPWQQHRRKEMGRSVNTQQIIESNTKKSLLELTTGTKAVQFGTANHCIKPVITVHFDDAVDAASSFDEEDLSSSYDPSESSGDPVDLHL